MEQILSPTAGRRSPIGAEITDNGVSFRVWAPKHDRAEIVFEGGRELPLIAEDHGYHTAVDPRAQAGDRYRIRLGNDADLYPDPASHYQPDGVHGPSQVVDHTAFRCRSRSS